MPGNVTPISKGEYPEQKLDQITSFDQLSLYSPGSFPRYNPDDLVARKGLAIYARMMCDDQVKPVSQFKRDAILGRGWQFKFSEDSKLSEAEQKRRTRVFNEILRQAKGSFHDALNGILSGREYGYSLTEKVYSAIDVDGVTYVGLNMLLTRDPSSLWFYTNEYGLIQRVVQQVNGKEVELDLSRFVHYAHAPEWDYVFGRSDLRAAYRPWYIKQNVQNLWLLYLERFQGGFITAKRTDDNAPSYGTPEFTALQNALNNVKSLASIILPRGIEIDLHFPATTDAFEKAVQAADIAIARSMLVPNLLGLTHAGQTGSYSQSQTQLEAFFWTLNADSARAEAALNEQLWRDLGDQNFGDGEYPLFCFRPASMEMVKWIVEKWVQLTGSKSVIPTEQDEQFLRKLLDLPARQPDAEPLVTPMDQAANEARNRELDLQAQTAEQRRDQEKQAEADAQARYSKLNTSLDNVRAELIRLATRPEHEPACAEPEPRPDDPPDDARIQPHGELRGCTLAQFNRAVQRVAFAVIERRTDESAERQVERLADLMATAVKRALGTDEQLAHLTDEDPSDIAAVSINAADVGKLKTAAKDALMQGWRLGQDTAINEMERAKGERFSKTKRAAHFRSLRDQATAYFEANGFRMAGNLSDGAKAIIQQELAAAVKYGTQLPEVRSNIWDRLVSRGFTTRGAVRGVESEEKVLALLDALWVDTEEDVAAYLNTLVRTNVFEALNEARFAEFTDPALGDFVQALEYAAVLDSSTTEICTELNGSTYRADSEMWDTYRPPNHYNALPAGTRVYTKHGYRPIEDLRAGTLVLTHADRYRRITETMMHETWPTEVVLHIAGGKQFVCTEDHPILTTRGWVCAGDLTEQDEMIAIEGPCVGCGTWTYNAKYCSKACSNAAAAQRFKAKAKVRECKTCGKAIALRAKKKNRLYCGQKCMAEGMRHLPVLTCEGCAQPMVSKWKRPIGRNRRFCSQPCYFKHKGETSIERTVREWLAVEHLRAEPQKRFGRYTVDFYLPDFRAVIEVDGDYWHTTKDKPTHIKKRREEYLTGAGLSLIRLPQSIIESGRFKRIISEWLHASEQVSATRSNRENRASPVQQTCV